jgi:type II secretory pathway pseudopilin PulG
LELVVVIAILAVVAGILVTQFPSLLNRSHNTAWFNNLVELDKAIAAYNATNDGKYPDGFDSLIDTGGSVYKGLLFGGTTSTLAGIMLEMDTLQPAELTALQLAGITKVQKMRTDPSSSTNFGATFFAYGSGLYENPTTLTAGDDGTPLLFLKKRANTFSGATTYNAIPMKIHLNDDHRYVVLGVGQACTLFGGEDATGKENRWSKDCPVLRHPDGCLNPEEAYCRALAIFDVTTSGKYAVAKFVGTVAPAKTAGMLFSSDMAEVPRRLE